MDLDLALQLDPFAPSSPSSASRADFKLRPPRRARVEEKLTRFSFINSYSAVEKDSNPLITGVLANADSETTSKGSCDDQQLHLDLYDLVRMKRAFESDNGTRHDLTLEGFVAAFADLVGSGMKQQLGYLFMKIDCNCDGMRPSCIHSA